MRNFLALSLVLLSCTAIQAIDNRAQAEVIMSGKNSPVIVPSSRDSNTNNNDQPIQYRDSNGGTINIYNGNSSNGGQALMMKDGKIVPLADGEYKLPNGQKVNIKNGRATGVFGNTRTNKAVQFTPSN